MIGDILNAVMQECKALLADQAGTVILKTDYKASNLPSYAMPLLLVDLYDATDSVQYPGGLTRVDWNFAFNSYHNAPDPKVDDDSGYSIGLLDVIDSIRQHFSIGAWLTHGMTNILNNYAFRFTLSGISPADALEQEGLIMGYKIIFDSAAVDTGTSGTVLSSQVLEVVDQINNPPFNF